MDSCDCIGCRREGDTRRDRMLPDRALRRWQNSQHQWADSDNALNALKERIRGCRGDIENHAVQVAIGWHGLQAEQAHRVVPRDSGQRVEPNADDMEVLPALEVVQGENLAAETSTPPSQGEATPDREDFLDRAVAAAIRRKGLSVLACTDFG